MLRMAQRGRPWEEIKSLVPPTTGFPYWTIYPVRKSPEGYNKCFFVHVDEIKSIELQDDQKEEEVNEDNGSLQRQVPSLLSEYRDLTY